eukprot:8071156-Pyramimonas_sp.AAC.1
MPVDVVMKLLEAVAAEAAPTTGQAPSVVKREADRVAIPSLPSHLDYTKWRCSAHAIVIAASS